MIGSQFRLFTKGLSFLFRPASPDCRLDTHDALRNSYNSNDKLSGVADDVPTKTGQQTVVPMTIADMQAKIHPVTVGFDL